MHSYTGSNDRDDDDDDNNNNNYYYYYYYYYYNARGTNTPTQGLASTLSMHTAISTRQWQPWTAVSPLLEFINMA